MGYLIEKPEVEKFRNEKKLTGESTFLHEYHNRYLVDSASPDRDVVPIALFLREGTGHNTQVYKVKSNSGATFTARKLFEDFLKAGI